MTEHLRQCQDCADFVSKWIITENGFLLCPDCYEEYWVQKIQDYEDEKP